MNRDSADETMKVLHELCSALPQGVSLLPPELATGKVVWDEVEGG